MTEFVVIRFNNIDQRVDWVHVDSTGTRQSGVASGTLEDAARDAGEKSVIVLIPATDALTTSVQLPVRSSAKIRAALPFALEEILAEDIENLHFATGARQDDGQIPVVVVALEKMREWTMRLTEAGIEASRIIPENHGLALIPGTMSMLVDDQCTMFNDGADTEFAMQDVKPSDVLVAAGCLDDSDKRNDDNESARHLIGFCTPEFEEKYSHDWNALRHELNSVDISLLPDGVLPKLAVTVASGRGVNLLQGAYGKANEYSSYLRPWKTAAMLLLGLGLVTFAALGVDYYRLLAERSELREQFHAEYRLMRPDDTRDITNPLSTVESLERSLGTSVAPQVFLPSIVALGHALETYASADIEAISYRAGVIDVRLTSPDVATLDKIQQSVSAAGRFSASIQSAEKVADKINGRIRIRESGS